VDTRCLLKVTVPLCLSESWVRDLTVLNDRPLSAAFYNLESLTGEYYLDELPELQIDPCQLELIYS
jgi:hypothetical protein